MVTVVLGAMLALQQLQATARVDRDAVALGDELVLTITVESVASLPVQIQNPDLAGLEILGSRDASSVTVRADAPIRVTTRKITLRAVRGGAMTIGPVRVRRGEEVVETAPIRITVFAPSAGRTAGLAPHVRSLLRQAIPPRLAPDEVTLTVMTSADSVLLGDQVDLLVVAWFPRTVRSRLRNPPSLEPPGLRGAWVYHRPVPSGISVSRQVAGVWYDLFVQHEAVFPLTAGELEIGPATVTYSLPLTISFLSRELRHEVRSKGRAVHVEPQPAPEGLLGFGGAAGRDLRLRVDVATTELPVGDASRVRAEISGRGNLSLWPEPEIAWPEGLRAYAEEVEVNLSVEDGLIGGAKVFHYLVVADSVGTYRVPAPRYMYFDVGAGSHVELRAAPMEFVTPSGTGALTPLLAAPPPLMNAGGRFSLNRVVAGVSWWVWMLVGVVPPCIAVLVRVLPSARRTMRVRRKRQRRRQADGSLDEFEREFRAILERLVPRAGLLHADELADALRAAGIEAPLAAQAARVRDRLQQVLFGPGGTTDPEELAAEVQEVLRVLVGESHRPARAMLVGMMAFLLCLAANDLRGQSPERLYQAGAARAAADSFAARAIARPLTAAHWYNLGNALQQLGGESRARAAWLRAARLAPRLSAVHRALASSPAPDRVSRRHTWVAPITAAEAFVAGLILWTLGWMFVAIGSRVRYVAVALLLAAALTLYARYVAHRYAVPVVLVIEHDTPLRAAPYGSAPARHALAGGTAVVVEEGRGPWVRVKLAEERGWLLRVEVVRL